MIVYRFVELGEGYNGEFDPSDPTDRELLRLDAYDGDEEIASYCTNLPVKLDGWQRATALTKVAQFTQRYPDLTPERVVTVFSHMDESWLESGPPANILDLFGLS